MLGYVAAGVPIEAVAGNETIAVPEDLVGRRDTYVLRVRGNSMIDEQIRDGDFVIVEDRKTAENGEMVIALLGGHDATLKKFYRETRERAPAARQPHHAANHASRPTTSRSRASWSASCGSTERRDLRPDAPDATLTHLIYTADMAELKQINFTIVPDDGGRGERTYANFCAISQTPFDCTLTFCEVQPLSEDEIRSLNAADAGHRHGGARARCAREWSCRSRCCRTWSRRCRNSSATSAHARARPRALRRRVADPRSRPRDTRDPRSRSSPSTLAPIPSSTTARRSSC